MDCLLLLRQTRRRLIMVDWSELIKAQNSNRSNGMSKIHTIDRGRSIIAEMFGTGKKKDRRPNERTRA